MTKCAVFLGILLFLIGGMAACGTNCKDACNTMTTYPFSWPESAADCTANCEADYEGHSCITQCDPVASSKVFYTCICLSCPEAFCEGMI